jgi:hypothetical protein
MPNSNSELIRKLNHIKNLIEQEDKDESILLIDEIIFEIEDGGYDMSHLSD